MLKLFSLEKKKREEDFFKKYKIKYKDVFQNNMWWRFYEDFGESGFNIGFFILYNETYLKWLELIEKYNFKIFYFKTSPKSNLKLSFIDLKPKNIYSIEYNWKENEKNYREGLDKDCKEVNNIKELQLYDLNYLYKIIIPEIFYIFPNVNKDNTYNFNFVIIVNENFNADNFSKTNFNLINIESFEELTELNITFEKVKTIFETRFILDNNITSFKGTYKLPGISYKEYIKAYKNNDKSLADMDELRFLDGNYMYKNFNQDLYLKDYFKLLCTQIWSLDEFYTKSVTNFGLKINKKNIYNVDSNILLKNRLEGSIIGKDKETGKLNIQKIEYDGFILSDCFIDLDLTGGLINKEYAKNGFIDFNNLKIEDGNTSKR